MHKPGVITVVKMACKAFERHLLDAVIMAIPLAILGFIFNGFIIFFPAMLNAATITGPIIGAFFFAILLGLYIWFHYIVAANRLLLLGEPMRLRQYLFVSYGRVWRLFGYCLLLGLLLGTMMIPVAIIMIVPLMLHVEEQMMPFILLPAALVWLAITWFWFTGTSMVATLVSMDVPRPIRTSWNMTHGLRLRIFVSCAIVWCLAGLPQTILYNLAVKFDNLFWKTSYLIASFLSSFLFFAYLAILMAYYVFAIKRANTEKDPEPDAP